MHQAEQFDRFLPVPVRQWIEQPYYARINTQAQLEAALTDPTFFDDPAVHLALFNDHGAGRLCFGRCPLRLPLRLHSTRMVHNAT
jgi:hypothetical protein